jgi:hypothetical protein
MTMLGNESVQKALRLIDRRLRAEEIADLDAVLKTPFGRRLYCRLVYELCNLEGLSFHPDIKDGVCAGRHDAYYEGQRFVGRVLFQEAQQHCPELWSTANTERFAKAASDSAHREQAIQKSAEEEKHD